MQQKKTKLRAHGVKHRPVLESTVESHEHGQSLYCSIGQSQHRKPMSQVDRLEKLDVELDDVPVEVLAEGVFPRRTDVTLRKVDGRVGVYRAVDGGGLLGVLGAGLNLDGNLDGYGVEVRSVRRPSAGSAGNTGATGSDPTITTNSEEQKSEAGAMRACVPRIVVRLTRRYPDAHRACVNEPLDNPGNLTPHAPLEDSLLTLMDEGVELLSVEDLRHLAGNMALLEALHTDASLAEWINRVVVARTFEDKRAIVRNMLTEGGNCADMIDSILRTVYGT